MSAREKTHALSYTRNHAREKHSVCRRCVQAREERLSRMWMGRKVREEVRRERVTLRESYVRGRENSVVGVVLVN